MFTSIVGDVNGDKVADVYASDFSNSASGPATGRVYLHSGVDGQRLFQVTGERPGRDSASAAPTWVTSTRTATTT